MSSQSHVASLRVIQEHARSCLFSGIICCLVSASIISLIDLFHYRNLYFYNFLYYVAHGRVAVSQVTVNQLVAEPFLVLGASYLNLLALHVDWNKTGQGRFPRMRRGLSPDPKELLCSGAVQQIIRHFTDVMGPIVFLGFIPILWRSVFY